MNCQNNANTLEPNTPITDAYEEILVQTNMIYNKMIITTRLSNNLANYTTTSNQTTARLKIKEKGSHKPSKH